MHVFVTMPNTLRIFTGLTTSEIIGNSLIFIFAGYETTATTLSLLAHNLALHPEIQERVYNEVKDKLNGVSLIVEDFSSYQ